MNKHQFRSLLGVIGGIFFMAGDCLIYCYKGNIGAEIDPLWIDVSMWRFVISAIFGFIGMSLMIPAYLSFTDDENQDLSGESKNGYVQNSKKVWKNLQEDSC